MNGNKCYKVGEKAPEFSLKDQNKKDFRLPDFKGKRILLSFHPLAWTTICANQMKSLEKNHDAFNELNTIAAGISIDSVPTKNAWAKFLNIKNTKLLSDFWPHGKVAKLFDLFREKDGFSDRANIIIDEEQNIEYVQIYEISKFPDIDEIITFLRSKLRMEI